MYITDHDLEKNSKREEEKASKKRGELREAKEEKDKKTWVW